MHVQRPFQVGPGFKGHSLHLRLQVHNIHALCRPLNSATLQQRTLQCQHALQSSASWVLARPQSSVSHKRRRRQGLPLQAVSITALGQPEPPKSTAAPVDSLLHSRHDRDILGLAVPALASILLDPLMSVVDTALVGRLGSAPLGAVGASTILHNFSGFLFSFLMVVTTPRVARAVANADMAEASVITAQGLWVAVICGLGVANAMWAGAPSAMARMGANTEVLPLAVSYLRCRALATPAALMMYVATGSFRGFKDTKTPLLAALVSNILNLGLDFFFMFQLGWGVAGAALATSASQYLALGVMLYMLVRKGMLQPKDLRQVPGWREVLPLLRSGLALSLRNLSSMVAILFATTTVTGLGTVAMAGHEILRQIWIFSIQGFAALDIATQTLVASYLGQDNRLMARQVLWRILQLGLAVGLVMAVVLSFSKSMIPSLFSQDPSVQKMALSCMPFVALCMPFDAMAAIFDGALLAAQDTAYVARGMVLASGATVAALVVTQRVQLVPSLVGLVGVWASLKLITAGRIITGLARLTSSRSPFVAAADGHQHKERRHSRSVDEERSLGLQSQQTADSQQTIMIPEPPQPLEGEDLTPQPVG